MPAAGSYDFQVVETLFLLVDDDNGATFEVQWKEALDEADAPFTTWNVKSQGSPSLEVLAASSGVVWFCGSESSSTLTDGDQTVLKSYLEGGGKLLLFGQDIGYELKGTSFFRDVLRAKFIKDSASSKRLVGAGMLEGIAVAVEGNESVGQRYPEVIEALAGATPILTYEGDGDQEVGGIAWSSPLARCAYFGIGLEGVDTAATRISLVQRLLQWFDEGTTAEIYYSLARLKQMEEIPRKRSLYQAREAVVPRQILSRSAADLQAQGSALSPKDKQVIAPVMKGIIWKLQSMDSFQSRLRRHLLE